MSNNNERLFPRINDTVEVQVNKLSYPLSQAVNDKGVSLNIGQGGICFKTKTAYEPDTLISVKIKLDGWRRHKKTVSLLLDDNLATAPLTAIGKTVWCKKESDKSEYIIGIIFVNIYKDDFQALKKHLSSIS